MENFKNNSFVLSPLCRAALNYLARGFSIIPIKPDKKPYIAWTAFKRRRATSPQIKEWWTRWPDAMIGIITGSISGVVVVDIDNEEGLEAIKKYIPDSAITPTCKTPRGGQHLYFKYPKKPLSSNTRAIPGCDLRSEGGYVIAPPSWNGTGKSYNWFEGLSIDEVEPADLPKAYISFINSYAFKRYKDNENDSHTEPQLITDSHKILNLGRRDNDLYHVANCLVKGRTPINEVGQYLKILAESCEPPFPISEAEKKIDSVLKRIERRERNIAEEVRQWVLVTEGNFSVTDLHKEAQLVTKEDKHAANVELRRMEKEGIIKRYGDKRGIYIKVESECEEINWRDADDTPLSICWPFGIEQYVLTLPKNIIVIAGVPNAGKTAFLLNVVEMNMRNHRVFYFSSEMGGLELKRRLSKFDFLLNEWSFTAKERTSNFADVIQPDDINIIDFLEVYDEFYKIGFYIKEIHDKLQKGIAIIAIQKNLNTDFGLGGMRGLEKARLYLAMERNKIKMVKAKNWANDTNPNGLELDFKLIQGCKFIIERDWHK